MVISSLQSGLRVWRASIAVLATLSVPVAASTAGPESAGGPGGEGLAIVAGKIVTAAYGERGVHDHGVLVVRDGVIEACGPARDVAIPAGYRVIDVGDRWLMPGMIDLHTHTAGGGYNDMVFQTNEGLRVSASVECANFRLRRSLASGVTTVLFIPGSGTNIGGAGVLLKTGLESFEDARVRDPGSLKIAQGDNPTRWGYGMGRSGMNYHIRTSVRKGLAYAKRWKAYEDGRGPKPELDPQFETFRALLAKDTQISTHTQYYPLVLYTISMLKGEFDLDVYIDHGEWMGFLTAEMAEEMGVAAIVGPRQIDVSGGRVRLDGKVVSCAGEYQKRGHTRVGFNTDAPVVPGEELSLQAAMSCRYGFDNSDGDAVRGLTIVPAMVAGIDHRVGSLEPGKDADVLLLDGDPADPRTSIEMVWIEGRVVYDPGSQGRLW